MRALEVTLRIKGLSMERVLSKAAQAGITLRHVRRLSAREMRLSVGIQDEAELTALLTDAGYGVEKEREAGAQRAARLLKRRAMFSAGAAIFSVLLFLAGQCVWRIEITGAGAAAGEVRRMVSQAQIAPGRPKRLIQTQALQAEIERRLPQIKYVDVRVRGMTLCVFCAQARAPMPADYGGEAGDIVARKSGIITEMIVRSGTPQVRVGEAVREGQLLVRGEERAGGEEKRTVAARAQIRAQTFYQGGAAVNSWELETRPTGRETRRTIIQTPWGEWGKSARDEYAMADVERTALPIGGGFWPLTVIYERTVEVEGERKERDRQTLQEESGRAAEQIARRNVPIDAEIVDKWVDYSMIEEGFCANVVLTCEEDIALAQKNSP